MTISRAEGAQALRKVLSFTFRLWGRRKTLAIAIAVAMTLATLTEVFVPLFAGRLIDALSTGTAAAGNALAAFLAMALLGLAMVVLRFLAWSGIVPLTLHLMTAVARDAFHRVQRLSTDWHANSFAGSTVRKITRGMWALDTLDDVLLLALLPAAVVLVGTVVLLGMHWPLMGVVMALAMRDRVETLIEGWSRLGHDLGFGVGIAQGFASLGRIGYEGRFDYAAIGTVTNLAARLCGEADAGQVLVSQRVFSAVEDLAVGEPVGALTLKGFSRPIRAFGVSGMINNSAEVPS